jgi:hypothetical protein
MYTSQYLSTMNRLQCHGVHDQEHKVLFSCMGAVCSHGCMCLGAIKKVVVVVGNDPSITRVYLGDTLDLTESTIQK